MPSSVAHVATERPERYLKQLASHLGRRAGAEVADGRTVLRFESGVLELAAEPGELTMWASADDPERLAQVQDVGGRHLVRFGEKDELVVTWTADS